MVIVFFRTERDILHNVSIKFFRKILIKLNCGYLIIAIRIMVPFSEQTISK